LIQKSNFAYGEEFKILIYSAEFQRKENDNKVS